MLKNIFSSVILLFVGFTISFADDLEINVGGTLIFQGTNNANAISNKDKQPKDISYSIDITLQKELEKGILFMYLESGKGNGIEDELTLYSGVNEDANDDNYFSISEFWYERNFWNDKFLLTFGKLDPTVYFDNNLIANDETCQFLGRMFVNNPAIEFPDYTIGARLKIYPLDIVELNYGLFDARSKLEDFGSYLFNIGQVSFKTKLFNLEGNYRLFAWHNNLNHTKWLDTLKTKESNFGFGVSIDQSITNTTALFFRYGFQNPEIYNKDNGDSLSLEGSLSGGFQIAGNLWNRRNDTFSFAIGQAIPSKDYKSANNLKAKSELHIETYYNIFVNEHLSITPDFQYILNPFGGDLQKNDAISVLGVRCQIDF